MRHELRCDRAARARTIVDDDVLRPALRQLLRDETRGDVGPAAGREADHDANWLGGIAGGLRRRDAWRRDRRGKACRDQECFLQAFLPSRETAVLSVPRRRSILRPASSFPTPTEMTIRARQNGIHRIRTSVAAFFTGALVAASAFAQQYPVKPIRFVLPFGAP